MRTAGIRFFAAWLGATLVAVVVAAAAVGSVRSQLTDTPTPLGASASATFPTENTTPSTSSADGAGADPASTTTTTDAGAGGSATSTSTSVPPNSATSSTSTTTPPTSSTQAQSYSRTFETPGGSVRVVVDGSDVSFGGAVPKTGWRVELKESGPQEVKVEFEQNEGSGKIEFAAKVEHGELVTEISSEDHDD